MCYSTETVGNGEFHPSPNPNLISSAAKSEPFGNADKAIPLLIKQVIRYVINIIPVQIQTSFPQPPSLNHLAMPIKPSNCVQKRAFSNFFIFLTNLVAILLEIIFEHILCPQYYKARLFYFWTNIFIIGLTLTFYYR